MKTRLIFMTVFIAALSTGCITVNESSGSRPYIKDQIDTTPLKADIVIGEKISGTATTMQVLPFFFGDTKYADDIIYNARTEIDLANTNVATVLLGWLPLPAFNKHALKDRAKNAAAYKAVKASGADIIIAPKYEIEYTDYAVYSTAVVTVTGYKGTYKNIRPGHFIRPDSK